MARFYLKNAAMEALADTYDAEILRVSDGRVLARLNDETHPAFSYGPHPYTHEALSVRVYPKRHHPCGGFFFSSASIPVTLQTSLVASKATAVFPTILPKPLWDRFPGERVREMTNEQKATLYNIYAKMQALDLWRHVVVVYRVDTERVHLLCSMGLYHKVLPGWRRVDGSLHKPAAEGYSLYDSFKTHDKLAGLQLTFFKQINNYSERMLVDADLDEAGGLEHVFDVLEHAILQRKTHPYDIHQLQLATKDVVPLYELT